MYKTQCYIDKYCEYIDRLIIYWQNGGDKIEIAHLAHRANFFHYILGINNKITRFHGVLINPNIHDFYYNLDNYKDDDYKRKLQEEIPLREQQVSECKTIALKISSPIKEIESGPYKGPMTKEGLEELLGSLKHIKKAILNHAQIDAIEGKNANRLVVELGLVSKWLKTAKECWLARGKKMPYQVNPNETFLNRITASGEAYYEYDDTDLKRIERWIEKVSKKICQLSQSHSNDMIPPEFKSAPTTLLKLAEYWGGDMTPYKVRKIIESNSIGYRKINRQTYEFDIRDLPKEAAEKLKL